MLEEVCKNWLLAAEQLDQCREERKIPFLAEYERKKRQEMIDVIREIRSEDYDW